MESGIVITSAKQECAVTTYRSQNKISTNDILAKIKQKGGNSNYIFPFLMYTVHTREKEV